MHRKLIILSMLIAIAFKATAQQQQIPYYTILLGQTKEWKTGSTIKSIAKGGNAECVKITFQGATANIKGMKLGLVELTATLSNGKTQKCKVRVTTSAPKTKWTGRYELKIPKDNWHIAYKNLGTGQMTRAGRIGNVFANVEDLGDEGGLVYNRFYYNLRAGYKAFSKDPKFQHCDDAGDIDGFASEYYFREFGPKNADESFVDGGWEEKGGDNVPIAPILDNHPQVKTVIVVYLKDERHINPAQRDRVRSAAEKKGVWLVEIIPSEDIGGSFGGWEGVFDASHETARRLIELGRKDARKVLVEAKIGEFCK